MDGCLVHRINLPAHPHVANIFLTTNWSVLSHLYSCGQYIVLFPHHTASFACGKGRRRKNSMKYSIAQFHRLKKNFVDFFFFLIFFTSANLWSYDSWQICHCKVTHLAYIWTGLYSAIYGRCYSTVDNKTDILCAIWHINRIQLGTVGKQTDTFNMLFYIVRIQLDTIAL